MVIDAKSGGILINVEPLISKKTEFALFHRITSIKSKEEEK